MPKEPAECVVGLSANLRIEINGKTLIHLTEHEHVRNLVLPVQGLERFPDIVRRVGSGRLGASRAQRDGVAPFLL